MNKDSYGNSVSSTGFYSTKKWKKLRQNILQRDGYVCQRCIQYGLINPAEIVHHKTELTIDNYTNPAISMNPDNLISVCRTCHEEIHKRAHHSRYKIDDDGEIIDRIDDTPL